MKRIITLMSLLFLLFAPSTAQNVIEKTEDGAKLLAASQAFNGGDYVKAVNLYREVLAGRPNDAKIIFHIGECYFYMDEPEKALPEFEKAKSIDEKAHDDIRYMVGRCYQMEGRLDEAMTEYAAAKNQNAEKPDKVKEIDYYFAQCQTAKSLMATPKPVVVTNSGAIVNSPYDDKRPSFTSDMKTMIFTSRRPGGKTADRDKEGDGGYFEDIYMTQWDSAGMTWGPAQLVSGAVNTDGHDACCSISPDGKTIFVYINNMDDAIGGDIYTSKKSSSGKWGAPKNMGKGINTSYFEDGAILSPDGNTLYFMSERGQDLAWKGQKGFGRSDIWMCKKIDKTTWGEPVNLGGTINTSHDEGGIYPAPDGKTLYFCSNGHNSMGGYDVFMTRLENDQWTTPVNVGYPINTIANERMFVITADGRTAYVDSDRAGGMGERDLWVIDMSALAPKPHTGPYMSLLTGTIFDGSGKPVEAELQIFENGTKVTNVTTSKEGNYQATLEGDKTYEIRIQKPGYKSVNETLKLEVDKQGQFELVRHFLLYKE